jgi:hypothetical protein
MTDRIVGRTGSPKRGRFLLGPMFVTVLLAVFMSSRLGIRKSSTRPHPVVRGAKRRGEARLLGG